MEYQVSSRFFHFYVQWDPIGLEPITKDKVFDVDKGNLGVPQLPGQGCSFHSFRSNTYQVSFMESPSGIKIILVTHPRTGDLREALMYIYNLYVEYVMKNPLYTPGTPIRCELFNTTLDQYVRGLG
ncbi:unnamed protein product [Ilex paraguariensis]|uniref:Trafficking protein particle complex subunit n=1 Tax=Ilex paraguariensis TaxID=185542 RepID=A0ABC8TJL0_9AQUA